MTYAGVVSGGADAMVNIATVNLSVAAATIDFSSISQTYQHLAIELAARGTSNATTEQINLRCNNDSGAGFYQYLWTRLFHNDATPQANQSTSATFMPIGHMSGVSSDVRYGVNRIFIPFYSQVFWHTVQARSSHLPSTLSSFMTAQLQGMHHANAAISRVTLYPNSGNFAAGTYCTLYGIT